MDRWGRWRPRKPAGRAGTRRAGVTALAVLLVTAALAVLLTVRYHLAWPPVAVAILGTLPALYLAWLAVPGVISPPEPGAVTRPASAPFVAQWHPVDLGVHQVIGGGPMPAYIRRPHDELLRAVLDPAVPASRLVVVRGGSSTGKSRAAYEAVAARLAGWRLDYPLDPGALAARLEAGIPARTVLWLGELRQYADAEGGAAVLAGVADLLAGEGHLVITTMWPEQWTAYTAAARAGPGAAEPAGTAGRLVERLPELTGDPAGIDPAAGSSTSQASSPPPTWPPRPPAATRCWRKRPRRPRAPGRAGRSPSTWPGSLTSWSAMRGRAVIRMGRRSSPWRWTPSGLATPARCPPRSCRTPRSAT